MIGHTFWPDRRLCFAVFVLISDNFILVLYSGNRVTTAIPYLF